MVPIVSGFFSITFPVPNNPKIIISFLYLKIIFAIHSLVTTVLSTFWPFQPGPDNFLITLPSVMLTRFINRLQVTSPPILLMYLLPRLSVIDIFRFFRQCSDYRSCDLLPSIHSICKRSWRKQRILKCKCSPRKQALQSYFIFPCKHYIKMMETQKPAYFKIFITYSYSEQSYDMESNFLLFLYIRELSV